MRTFARPPFGVRAAAAQPALMADKPEPYIHQLNEKLRGWSRQFKFRYYLSVAAIFPMTTTLRTREVLRKAVLQEFEDHPVEVVEEMQRLMDSVPKRLAAGVPQIPQIRTRAAAAAQNGSVALC